MRFIDAAAGFLLACTVTLAGCRSAPVEGSGDSGAAAATPTPEPAAAGSTPTSVGVVRLEVPDLTCEGCAWQIRETLRKQSGVGEVVTSVKDKTVHVRFDPARTTSRKVTDALRDIGYESSVLPDSP